MIGMNPCVLGTTGVGVICFIAEEYVLPISLKKQLNFSVHENILQWPFSSLYQCTHLFALIRLFLIQQNVKKSINVIKFVYRNVLTELEKLMEILSVYQMMERIEHFGKMLRPCYIKKKKRNDIEFINK